jgi:hypothetical protein
MRTSRDGAFEVRRARVLAQVDRRADQRPDGCPLIRAPSAVHRATCSSWISYASRTVRPSYCSVNGSTGLRLAYAPSSTSAISTRVP